MKSDVFLMEFQDILQAEDVLAMDTRLENLEEWDSLAVMATITYLDKKMGVRTTFSQYAELTTVRDIAELAGVED